HPRSPLFPYTTLCRSHGPSPASRIDVGDWLEKAADAVRTGNYRGVVVYLRGETMNTLRIVHRFNKGEEQERLVAMSGRPREIIRDRKSTRLNSSHVSI